MYTVYCSSKRSYVKCHITRRCRVMGTQDAGTWDIGHTNVVTQDTGTCGGMGCKGLNNMINKQHLIFALNL